MYVPLIIQHSIEPASLERFMGLTSSESYTNEVCVMLSYICDMDGRIFRSLKLSMPFKYINYISVDCEF